MSAMFRSRDAATTVSPLQRIAEVALAAITMVAALTGSVAVLPIQVLFTAIGIALWRTDGRWDLHERYRKVCACIYALAAITAIILQLTMNPWGEVEVTPRDGSGGWYPLP